MPPSNSIEKMKGFDFAQEERSMFEGADYPKRAKILQMMTSRAMENVG